MLTAAQQEVRAQGIGASEIGILFGIDPFRTTLDLWLEKTGRVKKVTPTHEALYDPRARGQLFEGVVAQLYGMTHQDHTIVEWGETVVHPSRPVCRATPDRRVEIPEEGYAGVWRRRLLECKTKIPRRDVLLLFGEPGTDQIPLEMVAQIQWQLAATGLSTAVLAVLLGFDDYREYTVHADAKLQGDMLDTAEAWWIKHVVEGQEPPIVGQSAADYLAQKYQQNSDVILTADAETSATLANLRRVRSAQASLEKQEEESKNLIKQAIGESRGIQSDAGDRVIWSTSKDSVRIDWQSIAGEYRTMLETYAGVIIPQAVFTESTKDEIKQGILETVKKHSKIVPGVRSFRFTPAKED